MRGENDPKQSDEIQATCSVHTLPFPQKLYPIPDQNEQIVYPFLDQNGAKILPDGVTHTYLAYIRGNPSGSRWNTSITVTSQ